MKKSRAQRCRLGRVLFLAVCLALAMCSFTQSVVVVGAESVPEPPPAGRPDGLLAEAAAQVQPVAAHPSAKPAVLSELRILPGLIILDGPEARHHIIVEGRFGDGHQEELTDKVELSFSRPGVAKLDAEGLLRPVADGKVTLLGTYQGLQATAQVEVKNGSAPFVWSFRNHVLPVMTKTGCNSGACHGAQAGKNGFKLTLRGYDPEQDYYTLTRQSLSRRTVKLEPANSLILLKPTMAIPHGGGLRFPVDSLEYQVISDWIAAGMPAPKESDPRIVDLEALPGAVLLRPGTTQQLLVLARFSDGSTEDVTRWAKFTSVDEGLASVNDQGLVSMRGEGEAAVSVWYHSRVAIARVTVPHANVVEDAVFQQAKRNNYIDDLVLQKLQTLRIPPSRPATDAEFLRRAYLDAAGILPTAAEAEAFLNDKSPNKRPRLIDHLLTRPAFVDYWAYKWSDVLLVSSNKLSPSEMWTYYNWVRESVAANKPWNQLVREIITAKGNTRENAAGNYFLIHRTPTEISENVTQTFLGTTVTCARCHNHPLEKWTQNDYYGLANIFSRVRVKNSEKQPLRTLGNATVYSSDAGEIRHPRLGRPLPPKPLDAKALPLDSSENRREYFADWLTSPENVLFARAIVNRVWANFMGRGLVEAVDDLRATNPPSNEELFDALVDDFVHHGYDIRYLIRTIMNSATYQTASEPNELNVGDEKYYSHYIVRRLSAEVLLDLMSQVTQVPEKFAGYPDETRALQLPDTKVESYFLDIFGRPPRLQARAGERESDSSITQALHAINGETINRKLRASGNTVDMLLQLGLSEERIVDYLYLAALSRYPVDDERRMILGEFEKAQAEQPPSPREDDPRKPVLRDLLWAMLTSKQFMFNL